MGKSWAAVGVLIGLAAPIASASAADWPQWRGLTRDGVAAGVKLPDPWPPALTRAWSLEVGLGHSSPVVAGGKVVQQARQGEEEVVRCIDAASGKVVWQAAFAAGPFAPRPVARAHGRGPFATPTVADGKVYTLGVSGVLACYDLASGKRLWQKTFANEYEKPYPIWGAANSPLIDGTRCILTVGTDADGALAAFHKDTGEALWRVTDVGPAYTSPQIATLAGKRQVVTLTHKRLCGADDQTGKLLWQIPFKVRYDMNIITPVVHGDLVVYSGYHEGTAAVRVAAGDGKLAAQKRWHNKGESMFMSSPVRRDGHIYGLSMRGKGTLVCLALADGKTAWASPGRMGEYASLVLVGDRLLVMTTGGDLLLVAADPGGYRELARSHLTDRPVWAHLAVTDKVLCVKDKTHLTCFALGAE